MSSSRISVNALELRTDEETQMLLRCLEPALEVRPSNSHGSNDCLTDSILLALVDQGVIVFLPMARRLDMCAIVRRFLVLVAGVSSEGFPFLAHDEHFGRICSALRQALLPWWAGEARPDETSFTLSLIHI